MSKFRYIDRDGKEYEVGQRRIESGFPYIEKRIKYCMPKETVEVEKLKALVESIAVDVQRNITPDEANTMVSTIKNYILQELENAEKFYIDGGNHVKNSKNKEKKGNDIVVKNMPHPHRKLVVARIDGADLSLWYYGSWDVEDREKAINAANEINGVLLEWGDDD